MKWLMVRDRPLENEIHHHFHHCLLTLMTDLTLKILQVYSKAQLLKVTVTVVYEQLNIKDAKLTIHVCEGNASILNG